MKNTLFLLADCANLTNDGKLNVMGIFNTLFATSFPSRHPTMHLVARLEAEIGETDRRQVTVLLRDPDGNELMRLSDQISFPPGRLGHPPEISLIFVLRDIVFKQPGPYQFVILVDEDYKGQQSLSVHQAQPLDAPQTP